MKIHNRTDFTVGLALLLVGLGFALASLQYPFGRSAQPLAWRPLLVIPTAIGLFGFLLPRAGLVITFPLVVIAIVCASREFRWKSSLIYAGVLTAGAWLLFVVLLKLPLPVWPAVS